MSAGISQQFCVRWNSHLGSLGAAFPQLLAGQRFVDVTLACEGHQVHCHRLVLAACSTYFESLLGENPCKHPIIILPRDIKLWEIQALVDFMYKGEVNVSQAGLPDLLKCAEILQIRGLCGSDATLNLNNITSGQQSMAGNTPLSSSSTSSSSSSSIGGASVSSITHSSHNVTATNATTTSATLTTTTSSSTSTLLGSSVVPAGSLTNSSSSSSSSAAAAVASLSSSVLAASTASGSGATNLNSNQTRNGGGGANGNKIIISCGQQQQSQIANNNQCSISSTAAGNNGGNGLDISSSTQITNILRNELMNPSIKFSTGQQSSSTSASSINASAAIITTPTASIEDGDDSANGSSNELNIKCEEMDDSDGKMRDDYADDMDGPGKLQADKTQQSNNHRPHHHQMPLLTQPTASEFVVIASRQPGTTGIRVKSNENLFENYTSSSHHHPSHIVTNLSDSSEINSDSLILHQHDGTPHQSSASLLLPSATSPLLHHNHHHHHTPSTMADYTIIDDDDNDDDDLANAQLLPPSLKFNRKTMQISVKNVVTSSAPLLSSSASSLSSASSTTNAAAAAGISAKQHHLSTKQHPNCDMNCTASTHHNHHQHHYHRHNESTIQRLSSESFESIICSPHLDQIPYMDDDDDDQVELMDQQAYVIDDDDDDDVKVIGRYTSGGQMPRLIPFGLLQNQIQNENNNELNIIAGSGGNGNSSSGGNGGGGIGFGGSNGGGGSGVGGTGNVGGSCNSNSNNGGNLRGGGEIHFNHGSHGRNSTQISTIRSMANSSMQQQQQRCNNINSNRKYDTKDSLLVINGDRGAPPPSAVVLRNPRGNQPRTYNTDALYAALMDVKFGESIYRYNYKYLPQP